MVLRRSKSPLEETLVDLAPPGTGEVRVRVEACGVCRTDLHVIDGELPDPKLPLIPGHEIVGTVADLGPGSSRFRRGDRIGIPWLGWTCGECAYCRTGRENLCDRGRFVGYTLDGGYAQETTIDERYAYSAPSGYGSVETAPLLCAGLIGFRSLRMAGTGTRLGFYGFGAAAHIAVQVARFRGQEVYAFTRPGDTKGQEFARGLGATWAGGSDEAPPVPLDAALIFAPVGPLVPAALRATTKGGIVVCAGIHMSDIPSFPYEILWEERTVRSVANMTRKDGEEFFDIAAKARIRTVTTAFPLARANEAVAAVREGSLEGAAVLVPE